MVNLPRQREELLHYLHALADPDYQQQVWLDKKFPDGIIYDSFDYAVNFLFDDTRLADAPELTLGEILENSEEIEAVRKVIAAIDVLLNTAGGNLTFAEYRQYPEWQDVITAAAEGLRHLRQKTGVQSV